MQWEKDLVKDIRTFNGGFDDLDWPQMTHPLNYDWSVEFTQCNRDRLLEYFLKVKGNCQAILEIGVCRNALDSSTYVFLNNKSISFTKKVSLFKISIAFLIIYFNGV